MTSNNSSNNIINMCINSNNDNIIMNTNYVYVGLAVFDGVEVAHADLPEVAGMVPGNALFVCVY